MKRFMLSVAVGLVVAVWVGEASACGNRCVSRTPAPVQGSEDDLDLLLDGKRVSRGRLPATAAQARFRVAPARRGPSFRRAAPARQVVPFRSNRVRVR